MSKITKEFAYFALNKFLKREILSSMPRGVSKLRFREMGILGRLYLLYPNEEFWKMMNLGYQLNSFAFFNSERGKDELKKQWLLFCLEKNLDSLHSHSNKKVDQNSKIHKIEDKGEEKIVCENLEQSEFSL